MKTAIVYYSEHHGNTKKLVDAIAPDAVIDVTKYKIEDLSQYDLIGFASGIYYGKFAERILTFAEKNLPTGKDVFFLATCGSKRDGYFNTMKAIALTKKRNILGTYLCLGFDTYGPFKLIGGIAKGHPTAKEIQEAVNFYDNLRIE